MLRSTDRFLTTHTGSLPRPPELTRICRPRIAEGGRTASGAADRGGRRGRGRGQAGRQPAWTSSTTAKGQKIKLSTYVKDRLEGFGGPANFAIKTRLISEEFSGVQAFGHRASWTQDAGVQCGRRVRDLDAVRTDVTNLKTALDAVERSDAFMTAASPGVVALFLRTSIIPATRITRCHRRSVMRPNTRDPSAGIVSQIDCPDLAMGRHIQYAGLSLQEFRRQAGNARRRRSTTRARMSRPSSCGCIFAGVTTRARTITTCRSPIYMDIVFGARREPLSRLRPPILAMRTSGGYSKA